jgi:peroxiredoxin
MGAVLLTVVAVGSFLGVLAALGILYHVVRAQGRFLIRLETLERSLQHFEQPPEQPEGLAVGEAISGFHLPDFTGRLIGLEEVPAKQILLVNWSPTCGFCERIAPDLGRLGDALRAHDIELVLVAHGNVESNRRVAGEHGIAQNVLLQDGSPPIAAFAGLGTPVAYLLDQDRRVARPLAVGSDELLALAQEVAASGVGIGSKRSLDESRLERNGLKSGTPAPEFELPTLDGRSVALGDYGGAQLLLLFSDPHCSPCNALLPELARLHRDHGDELPILMITRGEVAENRAYIAEHGIDFTVALQPGWRISKRYGIFETPVAFLIDEEGRLVTGVARGRDEILAVVRHALARRREVQGKRTLAPA